MSREKCMEKAKRNKYRWKEWRFGGKDGIIFIRYVFLKANERMGKKQCQILYFVRAVGVLQN